MQNLLLTEKAPQDDYLSPEETVRRRDAALRRALDTPPQPKHGKVKESKAGQPVPAAKRGKRRRGT